MARVARLAGAILVESDGRYFLVGNTKHPCAWAAAGFQPPAAIDALARPWIPLAVSGAVTLAPPVLTVDGRGEAIADLLARRFLIERNGSVSDRLWRVVVQPEGEGGPPPAAIIDARWLEQMPAGVWQIVRDTVLRCV